MSQKKKFHSLNGKFKFESEFDNHDSSENQDQPSSEEIDFYNYFMESVQTVGELDLKLKMNAWEQEKASKPINTLSEVEDSFKENMLYREILCVAERGNSIKIKNPKRQFEWDEETQTFHFQKKIKDPLNFEIENNCRKHISTGKLKLNEKIGQITLPIKKLKEGRYYLKVFSNTDFFLIDFFINKALD